MSIARIRSWYWSLSKVDTLLALAIVTITSLLIFRLPLITHFRGIYFNETFQYLLVTLFGLACVLVVRPPTISYFGWPRIRWVGAFICATALFLIVLYIQDGYLIKQPLRFRIAGVISILFIGFGEEMISRVLVFGTLQRFGTRYAVLASSAIFGLMHINVYLPDWSSWDVYWHVMSAMGFGLFACALFIATRSYWIVAIVHGLADWSVVFDKKNTVTDNYSPGILEGLRWGLEGLFLECGLFGLLFLFILRGRWPKWVIHLAIKWKLIEQAEAVTESNQWRKIFSRFRKKIEINK